jgi:ribonuclease HII
VINKKAKKSKYIIGIDEVGRGPLAGPVVVCALALDKNALFLVRRSGLILRDSKKLTPLQREKWLIWIKENKIPYAVASISPRTIDKINISNAANLAAEKSFNQLVKKLKVVTKNCRVFLDGGLYLGKSQIKNYQLKTVIRGDEKIPAISLASIVAKVIRDKKMEQLHKKYFRYGFDKHKGYGTKRHFCAIKKNGICILHRKTFLKNL